jgi:hypothetical protein
MQIEEGFRDVKSEHFGGCCRCGDWAGILAQWTRLKLSKNLGET